MNSKKHIGLVDDDEAVRFSTEVLLSAHQYNVDVFDSAEALLEMESLAHLDCLIIDFRMKGLSGLQLLNELKNRKAKIPAIILSGYISDVAAIELKAAGAVVIMDKPVDTQKLVANLRRFTECGTNE